MFFCGFTWLMKCSMSIGIGKYGHGRKVFLFKDATVEVSPGRDCFYVEFCVRYPQKGPYWSSCCYRWQRFFQSHGLLWLIN